MSEKDLSEDRRRMRRLRQIFHDPEDVATPPSQPEGVNIFEIKNYGISLVRNKNSSPEATSSKKNSSEPIVPKNSPPGPTSPKPSKSVLPDDEGESAVPQIYIEASTSTEAKNTDNPAGVILTKPEYYIYPPLKDLHEYMNDEGDCIVQGLTIGRRGYGNLYFPDAINISNMNFDELVHFRYREVILYPDDRNKPPVGEGLNRPALVILEKIYPRKQGTDNDITDVREIVEANFVQNLRRVTLKQNARFVDYRPKTGSWLFKVQHFSKYAFTESDEEECEIGEKVKKPEKLVVIKKPQEPVNKLQDIDEIQFGLGGSRFSQIDNDKDSDSFFVDPMLLEECYGDDQHTLTEDLYHTTSAVQSLKSSLFTNLKKIEELKEVKSFEEPKQEIRSEVIVSPNIYKLPDISLLVTPEKITTTERCIADLGIFRCNTFKVGWSKGFNFYTAEPIVDTEVVFSINQHSLFAETSEFYNTMMPSLQQMFEITLDSSEFRFDKNNIPTLHIRRDLSYLERQSKLFNNHVIDQVLTGRGRYLCSVWNLCMALWGPGDNSSFARRQNVSDWVKEFAYDLSDEWTLDECMDKSDVFKTIFNLVSFYKITEAAEYASKNNLNRLSLMISQMSANEKYRSWMCKFVESLAFTAIDGDDFKKLYLLLTGIPIKDGINTCEDLDWLRSFGLHLWYIAPCAAPVHVAFYYYKKAFEELNYATKPRPPYCDSQSSTFEHDLLYHILAVYVDSTHQLCKVLHPETHTENALDYRLSWFLLQMFLSLKIGLIRDCEKVHLHTTFATQLENMGLWKWAIFTLLFLENNSLKKKLITEIMERNLATFTETASVEDDLVETFKIPASWIHEVKAVKAKTVGFYYDYLQHCIYTKDWYNAYDVFVDRILPDLFVSGHYDHLTSFINKLEPCSHFVDWQNNGGLIAEFLDLQDILSEGADNSVLVGARLNAFLRRIVCFPVKNDEQKLCVAELSKKCALLFKLMMGKDSGVNTFQSKFLDSLDLLLIPPDIKHYEIFNLISRSVKKSGGMA